MTNRFEAIRQLRAVMMDYASAFSDEKAAKYPFLYKSWQKDTPYKENDRREHGGVLYKCRQAHVSREIYTPDTVPALWAAINAVHDGTFTDPIPAVSGMEYIYGLYYIDPEDSNIYLCTRSGEADGGTVILQYLPHQLIGQYFVLAV